MGERLREGTIFLLGEKLSPDAQAQLAYLLEALSARLPHVATLQLPSGEWHEAVSRAASVVALGQIPPEIAEFARSNGTPFIYWLIDPPAENGRSFAELREISAAASAIAIPSLEEKVLPAELTRTPQVPVGWGVPAASETAISDHLLTILDSAEITSHQELLQRLGEVDVVIARANRLLVLETLARGKCVAVYRSHPFSKYILDGVNGIVLSDDDGAAIRQEIARKTSGRLAKISAGARHTWEVHFQIERLCDRFIALIDQAQRGVFQREPTEEDYKTWVARFDTISATERTVVRRRIRAIPQQPLISIVLPVFNPDLRWLREAIDSVQRQIYPRWELCVADDASTQPGVKTFLQQYAAKDTRIKVVFRESNGHIAACSNSALELATGEWIALLDQDDVIPEHALACVATTLHEHPDAGLIYSDEDKLDEEGFRCRPFFKPDWNPELLLGQNCISHLGVYRATLIREVGGFREGFEGSQDYDLALRCVEKLGPEQIVHIPRVLYHWRMAEGSVATAAEAKSYAPEAARRAIADHLRRRGIAGRVEACPENREWHRVIYDLPTPLPLVSIIIPTRDQVTLLQRCISGIRERTDYSPMEVVIVDNGSTNKETHLFLNNLEKDKNVRVLRDAGEFNFSRLINRGAEIARGPILAFLNNDMEVVEPGWLRELVSHAMRPEIGAAGARLWYPDKTLQHGGVVLGLNGVASHAFYRFSPREIAPMHRTFVLAQNTSAVTAACMVLRKAVFDRLGGFDENLPTNFNDVDFCLHLRERGLLIVFTPYANLIHHESVSRGRNLTPGSGQFRDASYMEQRWGRQILRDPYYSPNLSLHSDGFTLAFPPRLRGLREDRVVDDYLDEPVSSRP